MKILLEFIIHSLKFHILISLKLLSPIQRMQISVETKGMNFEGEIHSMCYFGSDGIEGLSSSEFLLIR